MVIDFHAHYPRQEGFLPRLVETLPRAGIDRIVLCSAGPEFGHVSNNEVREAFERYPECISGLALVRLGIDPPELVDEAVRQGFLGIKTTNPTASYDDPSFYKYYERIEKHRLAVLFHTGIVMRTAPTEHGISSERMRPGRLDAVARAFPEMNIVAAHLGVPWHEEASMLARIHPNLYVDLTGAWWGGWRVNKNADFYRYHFFWPGAWDKVLFGTDILKVEELEPSKQFHDKIFEPLGLDRATMDRIYGGTAARLLHLDG